MKNLVRILGLGLVALCVSSCGASSKSPSLSDDMFGGGDADSAGQNDTGGKDTLPGDIGSKDGIQGDVSPGDAADAADLKAELGDGGPVETAEELQPTDTRQDAQDVEGETVLEVAVDTGCKPDCGQLFCGSDGCGGTCACPKGYACPVAEPFGCKANCNLFCSGRECGPTGLLGECDCGTCDDKNPCTLDTCDDSKGKCAFENQDGGCDDKDPCTKNDYCEQGQCTGMVLPLAELLAAGCLCGSDEDCQRFDDGNMCNGSLRCVTSGGLKVCSVDPQSVPNCDDGLPCTVDNCDPAQGCVHPPATALCDDKNPCTVGDACDNGVCKPGSAVTSCDDKNPCTDDFCDPLIEGGCVHLNNKVECLDNNPCTLGDACFNGECIGGAQQKNCDDKNPCTDDYCDPARQNGCAYRFNAVECNDSDPCTTTDVCTEGLCVGAGTKDCNDNNVCTTDTCVKGEGCKYSPATGSCEDGDSCTKPDTCQNGICVAGPNDCICTTTDDCKRFDDGNYCNGWNVCNKNKTPALCELDPKTVKVCGAPPVPGCTEIYCEPGDGLCKVKAINNGLACSDSDPCTKNDLCTSGACVGTVNLGGPCDDKNLCTFNDVCQNDKSCVGNAYTCNGHGVCKGDGTCTCDPHYGGAQCGVCGKGYFNYPTCNRCAAGYEGYPNCTYTYVRLTGGTFIMGSPVGSPGSELGRGADETQHSVTLTYKFEIAKYEVTRTDFVLLAGYDPNPATCLTCPVNYVSWNEALVFANSMSSQEGYEQCFDCPGTSPNYTCSLKSKFTRPQDCPGFRLPTEAEWEYSVRASSPYAYYIGGNSITGCALDANLAQIGWYCYHTPQQVHIVGQKKENSFGLFDMSGNVWEWVWDWYGTYPGDSIDPFGPSTGPYRGLRGGSYSNDARLCRSASRGYGTPTTRYANWGFRLVRTVQ